jgi:gliding motility-associated-like protein
LDYAVFDRWGEKVFSTNDVKVGWDGTKNGVALDAAVFVWYIKATVDGVSVEKHGNVTLIK